MPKEIETDNDNSNPLLDIISTLQEKLDSSKATNTYSKPKEVNNNINYNYSQKQDNANFDISNIFNMLNGFNNSNSQQSNTSSFSSNPFANIDMETMMRVGKIFSTMNKEDPRKNLLLSLKPFLRDNRQKNVDTYIFILGILNVLDSFNNGDSGF